MPVFRFVAFAIFVLSCASPSCAQTPLDASYASVLRAFNPGLDSQRSLVLADRLIAEADAERLDARLMVALIAVESAWNPRAASQAGALGLGQLMPATAAELGVDPRDPEANIHGVAVHLRTLFDRYAGHDTRTRYILTLSAYNAGAGAVAKFGGMPPYRETQHYVRSVVLLWRRLAGVR